MHKSAISEDMARILNISIPSLEHFSKMHYGMNFETLRDMHRFRHFWNEFTNPVNAELPILSIISLCGFSSIEEFNKLIEGHKEESKIILKNNFSKKIK